MERIVDLATNIAEDVVFMVEGDSPPQLLTVSGFASAVTNS
jgi:phosphate uptake regulator